MICSCAAAKNYGNLLIRQSLSKANCSTFYEPDALCDVLLAITASISQSGQGQVLISVTLS